jgi:hypothetical protein
VREGRKIDSKMEIIKEHREREKREKERVRENEKTLGDKCKRTGRGREKKFTKS